MVKIKPITLVINEVIWLEFCNNVPDTRKKNGTIVELIEDYNWGCARKVNKDD